MKTSSFHILMTGAGAPGAPGILHCLKQDPSIKITLADADPHAVGAQLHDHFELVPSAGDPAFIESIESICTRNHIDLVLPLVTRELFPLSAAKHALAKKGIRILVSDPDAIKIANDKSACYTFLKEKGIPVPEFFVTQTLEGFVHAAFELGHPHRPFCFKPSVSNGSRGVRLVFDSLDESAQLFYEKPYNLSINYAQALHILSSKPFPELLVCELLDGEEYSVDCLADHGKAILVVPRTREKMINGISVRGKFVNNKNIIRYCESIIEAIGLHGNIGIQLKTSSDGQPLLLEINPRVQGTIVAALGAGVNLPLLAVRQEMGHAPEKADMQVKWGTGFMRYWTEVFFPC